MDQERPGDSIEQLFGDAHQALHQAWERCLRSIHACERSAIAQHFGEFAARMRRQIRLEEEILFPALAREAGKLETDPIVLMRAEHREIQAALAALEARIEAHDCAALYGQHVGPSALFRSHLSGEENVLYPMADLLLSPAQRAKVVELARAPLDAQRSGSQRLRPGDRMACVGEHAG